MPVFNSPKTYAKGATDYKAGIKVNPYKQKKYHSAWQQGWFEEGYKNDPVFKRTVDIKCEGGDAFRKGVTECPYTDEKDIADWQQGWENAKKYSERLPLWDTD